MTIDKLIGLKQKQFEQKGYIEFTDAEISALQPFEIDKIEDHYRGYTLMLLPESEIEFFEWLKETDRAVWDDLWGGEDDLYHVSIDFLHHFTAGGNGFPICDLVDEDNYWFSEKHIKAKGKESFESIAEKIDNKKKLSFEETLLLEIVKSPIDIWHLCHRYNIPIEVAKQKVEEMHHDDILVHLCKREDLVKYIDV